MERGALSCASAWIHDAPFSHRSSFSRFLRCVRFISREPGVVGASDIKRSDSCAPARRRSILQKVSVDGAQTLPVRRGAEFRLREADRADAAESARWAEEQDATLAKTLCSRGPCDEMVRRKEPWAR